jgi:predicted RNA binding protein with dsRBD fold (UPF0201 family)/adenylate kinase family enzyme
MKLIAFLGLTLSGKSTAATLAKELGIPVIVMGDVVREEVRQRSLELSYENVGRIAAELREKEGMDAIARRCIPTIRERAKKKGIVVIDGVRGIAEVKRFKKEFGSDFILINIESPIEIRFERALKRGRDDDPLTIEELRSRDERELSWNMSKAIEVADFTIENVSDIKTFMEKVRDILTQLARQIEIEITTEVHPTEDEGKVIGAIKNIFPDAEIRIEDGKIVAFAKDLSRLRDLLRRQRILDTARAELMRNREDNEITVYFNKQTATVSRINFTDEDAVLSPLKVTFRIYGITIERFIDYLAPETKDGKPVKELDSL